MEMGIAVISGNLPLLRPLFEQYFRTRDLTKNGSTNAVSQLHSDSKLTAKNRFTSNADANGFERISEDGSAGRTQPNSLKDIEMADRTIHVKTEYTVKEGEINTQTPEEIIGNRVKYFSHASQR